MLYYCGSCRNFFNAEKVKFVNICDFSDYSIVPCPIQGCNDDLFEIDDDVFPIIQNLNSSGYFVEYAMFDSTNVYILFHDVYEFKSLPKDFYSSDGGTCYKCPTNGLCFMVNGCYFDKHQTEIHYSGIIGKENTPEQIKEIIGDVADWTKS